MQFIVLIRNHNVLFHSVQSTWNGPVKELESCSDAGQIICQD